MPSTRAPRPTMAAAIENLQRQSSDALGAALNVVNGK